jgi:ubiquinol-cytochrome c reductase cytochrome c1 subunit
MKNIKALLAVSVIALAAGAVTIGSLSAATGSKPKAQEWSFHGLFGTFDRGALQRGFQVYKQVCSGCHGLKHMAYRNLTALGYSEDQVKAFAADVEVRDGPNDNGEMFDRKGKPSDRFKSPFPNEQAARAANNGAYPPDLSVITKARPHGADYLYALMTGYKETPPQGVTMPEGMFYNEAFPGHQIAMVPPLAADAVQYQDGTKATVEQMAKDVTTFLSWASEPELEERKSMGRAVIIFLIVLTAFMYALKRKIWSDLH